MSKELNFQYGNDVIKYQDDTSTLHLHLSEDGYPFNLSRLDSLTLKVGNENGYLLQRVIDLTSIPSPQNGDVTIPLDGDIMTKLVPDDYNVEMWAEVNPLTITPEPNDVNITVTNNLLVDEQAIFPSDGNLVITVDDNINASPFDTINAYPIDDIWQAIENWKKNTVYSMSNDLSSQLLDKISHWQGDISTELKNELLQDLANDEGNMQQKLSDILTKSLDDLINKNINDAKTELSTDLNNALTSNVNSQVAQIVQDLNSKFNDESASFKTDLENQLKTQIQSSVNDTLNQMEQNGSILATKQDLTNLQNELNTAINNVSVQDNFTSRLNDLNTSLQTVQNSVSNLQSSLATTNQTLSSATSSISANSSAISANSNNISSLQSSVATNSNSILSLQSSVANNSSAISSNANSASSAVGSLQTSINSNSSAISSNAVNIANNSNAISSNANLTSQAVTQINNNISNIQTNVSNLSNTTYKFLGHFSGSLQQLVNMNQSGWVTLNGNNMGVTNADGFDGWGMCRITQIYDGNAFIEIFEHSTVWVGEYNVYGQSMATGWQKMGGVAQLQQFFNENFVYKQNEIIDSSVSIDDINSTKYLDGIYHCLGWTNGAPNGTSGNGILTKTSMGADTMIEFTDTVNHARYWTSTVWGAFRGGWNQY